MYKCYQRTVGEKQLLILKVGCICMNILVFPGQCFGGKNPNPTKVLCTFNSSSKNTLMPLSTEG